MRKSRRATETCDRLVLKATLLSGAATVSKVALGLVLNKMVAVLGGPAAVALFGTVQNLVAVLVQLATAGTSLGVVKYLAEFRHAPERQAAVLSTAITISLIAACFIALTLVVGRTTFAELLFFSADMDWILLAAAAGMIGTAGFQLVICWLNGNQLYRHYAALSISADLIALALAAAWTPALGWLASIVAITIAPSAAFAVVAIGRILRTGHANLARLSSRNIGEAKRLGRFAVTTLVSLMTVYGTQMVVRTYVTTVQGAHSTGLWQALWYVSDAATGIVVAILAPVLLPKFSTASDPATMDRAIRDVYRFLIPAIAIGCILGYALRNQLMVVLFSREFSEAALHFDCMLVGSAARLLGWAIGFMLLAQSKTRLFIVLDLSCALMFIGLTVALTGRYGLRGVALSFAASYVAYATLAIGYYMLRQRKSDGSGSH